MTNTKYIYGMRNRPIGPGCQPDGFIDWQEDPSGGYHNIIFYPRRLSLEEAYQYELDYLGVVTSNQQKVGHKGGGYAVYTRSKLNVEEYLKLNTIFNNRYELECHAFGVSNLSIHYDKDGSVRMQGLSSDANLIDAGLEYLEALANFAKNAKRINHREPAKGTSEKYAFRTWLNRIGLKGPEYKATRKTLLANLEGSAAYAGRNNDEKKNTR